MRRLVLVWGVLGQTAWAAQVCETVDVSTWSQEQKVRMPGIAYRLAFLAGQDQFPTVQWQQHIERDLPGTVGMTRVRTPQQAQVCFTDPTFNVHRMLCDDIEDGVCAGQKLKTAIEIKEMEDASEVAAVSTLRQQIDSLDAQIDQDNATWDTLTSAQRLASQRRLLQRDRVRREGRLREFGETR